MKPVVRTVSPAALIAAAVLVGPPQPAAAQNEAVSREKTVWVLRFDLGGSQLTEEHLAELDEVGERLRAAPRLAAQIVGHSDNQGPEPGNLHVSRLRAEAAKAYLVSAHGIVEQRLTTRARGSLKPVASNETAEGRLRNRRVVIALQESSAAERRRAAGTWVLRFDFGGTELSPANAALLDEVAMEMRLRPQLQALIVGHSDNSGQEPINLLVSQQRAEAARSYLVGRRGIDEQRIRTQGKGSTRPVASNETAEGLRQNRRAVIVLEDPAVTRAPVPAAPDEPAKANEPEGEAAGTEAPPASQPTAAGAGPPSPADLPPVPPPPVGQEEAAPAVRGARFEPAKRDGAAGRMWVNIVVTVPAGA